MSYLSPHARRYRLKKFARIYLLNDCSATEAYQKAFGVKKESAKVQSVRYMKDLEGSASDILKELGITIDSLLQKTNHIADTANKPVIVNKELVDYPDNPTRLNALEKLLKISGALKDGTQIDNRQVHINITPEQRDKQERAAKKLLELRKLRQEQMSLPIIEVESTQDHKNEQKDTNN